MPYSTADIRNIALVGQAGAGKTLLAEALLAQSGAIRSKGSLARGTTVCDFDPQEKALLHSLDAAICGFETQGRRVNIIDTPGYPDFLGRTLSALEAVETAVDRRQRGERRRADDPSHDGVRTEPRPLPPHRRQQDRQPRGAHREGARRDPRPRSAGRACRSTCPPTAGTAVVDCFFQARGTATDFSSVEAAHTEIIDQVVEVDENLMALYLEQGEEITPEQLHDPFEQALREDHLVPICFCSAETGTGIPELLQRTGRG